jgi:mono/diheme cytochrome c family protein
MSSRKAGEETMRQFILAFCMTLVFGAAPARSQQPAQPGAQAAHGYALFLADGCSECHGTIGHGSRVSGPRLAPQTLSFEAFLQVLRHPISDMPPYVDKMLSDADARDIHAYLQSIPGPTHAVSDIPALNH